MSEQQNTLKIHRLPFTQVPNELICSDKISGVAKALWCVFYSKPDNWTFFWKEIENNMKEGRDSVRKAAKELEILGYLKKNQKKINTGKGMVFGGMEIELFPYPNQQIQDVSSNTENPYSRNSDTSYSNSTISNSRNADTYKERNNKDLSNKDLSNIKKPKTNFTIPTDEELKSFFENFCSDWEEFRDHFDSNGWKVGGKTPMVDWKAAAKNWERRHKKYNPDAKPKNPTKVLTKNTTSPQDPILEKIRNDLRRDVHTGWQYFFDDLQKTEKGFKITAKSPKAAEYKEILDKLNIELM